MITEYMANPHLNANDRFAKLESWLAVLIEKVFPGLVPPVTDPVLEPAATIGFRAGPWIPASLDRLERPVLAGALRALVDRMRDWNRLFPFLPKNRPSLGRGPRLVELPGDYVDEAVLKRHEEELGRWNDALKSTNKRVIEAMNEFIGPFKRLRGQLVDHLLQADERALAEEVRDRPGYLGLILDRERRWVSRSGLGSAKVDLAKRAVLWGLLVQLLKSGEAYCPRALLQNLWETFGGAGKPEPGTVDDAVNELKKILENPLRVTIKVSRRIGWGLEGLED